MYSVFWITLYLTLIYGKILAKVPKITKIILIPSEVDAMHQGSLVVYFGLLIDRIETVAIK